MKPIRQEFADTMLEVGIKDDNLVVLIGDISHFVLQPFAKACPGRFYNIGICENTIVNMAAGLSKLDFHPVVHTISPFILERSFEQIKLDFGYQKLGVNIICNGSAFDYSDLGVTHHTYGDFALLKTIENMEIIYPGSSMEFNLLFKQTYSNKKPTFFRVPKFTHEHIFNKEEIIFGKGIKVKEGTDLTIIVTGPQLKTAKDSLEFLDKKRISSEIIYLPTIKPLDNELIIESLKKTKNCLVIEEHGKYGGLFDDILRICKNIREIRFESINIGDKFIHKYGTYAQHCKRLGFSVDGIIKKVSLLLGDK